MKPLKSTNNTKTKNPWSIQTFKGLEVKQNSRKTAKGGQGRKKRTKKYPAQ